MNMVGSNQLTRFCSAGESPGQSSSGAGVRVVPALEAFEIDVLAAAEKISETSPQISAGEGR